MSFRARLGELAKAVKRRNRGQSPVVAASRWGRHEGIYRKLLDSQALGAIYR